MCAAGCGPPPGFTPNGSVVTGVLGYVSIAADSSRVAVVHRGGGASVIDVRTGETEMVDETATAIAVGGADSEIWFATPDGRILRRRDGAKPWLFANPTTTPGIDHGCIPIDGLMVRGKILAWSSSATGQGGLYDTETEQELSRHEELTWLSHPAASGPLLRLTHGGSAKIFRMRGQPAERHPIGARWVKACFAPHPSTLDHSRATDGSWIYYTTRQLDGYRIERLATQAEAVEVIDVDSRGGPVANLILSPSGQYLLEGDPLDPGIRAYDLERADGSVQRTEFGLGEAQMTPVGFCVLEGIEHIVTRGPHERGVRVWTTDGLPLEGAPFPSLLGRFVSSTGPLPEAGAQWALVAKLDENGTPGPLDLVVLRVPAP